MTPVKIGQHDQPKVNLRAIKQDNPQNTYRYTTIQPGSFWGRRRDVVRTATLRYQLDMLRKTGRYDCFKPGFWHEVFDEAPHVWPVPKHLFWDSDLGKWIEGASYLLADETPAQGSSTSGEGTRVEEMESAIAELVERFRNAQAEDGYLNLHYQFVAKGMRWTNLRDMHELYNAGHLIEAALAHQQYYGNDKFLEPILRYVALLCREFGNGPGQKRGYPGHPEVELALLRLYKSTGEEEHFRLAKFFIDERGNTKGVDEEHYYDVESRRRGDAVQQLPQHLPYVDKYSYMQAHLPITEQPTIEGHSVRAMYLLTAVADLCILDSSSKAKYMPSLHRLWDNMVQKKMYLTGGIGAMEQWEGFGIEYFLPQSTDEGGCYSETCAAIGVVMLAERMLRLDLNRKYADILELALYNAVLTGMSHDGKAFTYTNQLASSASEASKRSEWFDCACCPPNVTRLLGYLAGYIWHHGETGENSAEVNVFLYMDATLEFEAHGQKVTLSQSTKWPLDGRVEFTVQGHSTLELTIRLRIPGWAKDWNITPTPPSNAVLSLTNGFLTLDSTYLQQQPTFTLDIAMPPRLIRPHPFTNQHIAAVARGPLVYCVEDVDNEWVDDHFKSTYLNTTTPLTEEHRTDIFTDNEAVIGIRAEGAASFLKPCDSGDPVEGWPVEAEEKEGEGRKETLRFIPYFARANRQERSRGMMRVGLRVL